MTVFVDEAIFEWRDRRWAHLFTDGDAAELHAFAATIGLKREWFQCPPKASWEHYDVTTAKRGLAIRCGAVAVDRFAAFEHRLQREGRLTDEWRQRLAACRERNAPAQGALL